VASRFGQVSTGLNPGALAANPIRHRQNAQSTRFQVTSASRRKSLFDEPSSEGATAQSVLRRKKKEIPAH
jgi:hypothetical protein